MGSDLSTISTELVMQFGFLKKGSLWHFAMGFGWGSKRSGSNPGTSGNL